jgi:hypothetical protein
MTYDQLLQAASGYYSIAGWQPQAAPQLVTYSGRENLNDLLALAGVDELEMEHALSGVAATPSPNPAMQQAIAQRLVNSGLMVSRERPTKAREFPLGFESSIAVPAGNTATITSRPQVPFRGERLIVPSDIAGSFVLLDLRVGKNSQFTSTGAVPARTFQENAVGIRLSLDTAQISQDISISVQNIGGAPQTFRASIIGSAVE